MTAGQVGCPRCAAVVGNTDRFCESCGAPLTEVRRVSVPRDTRSEDDSEGPCPDCGNQTYADGYCTGCGHRRAEPDRDEAELGGAALITDRGLEHTRNEDAAAVAMVAGPDSDQPYAIAIAVCDGVSSTRDPHTAAAAASRAGVEAMIMALTASRQTRPAVLAGLAAAADAAMAVGAGSTDPSAAPSCTYAAAAVVSTGQGQVQISVGNVGDSRVYWLPAPPAPARQLTVDDSLAQELIAAGVPADSNAVAAGAHTLTRWLGCEVADEPWSDSSVQTITTAESGALLVCTDGLWNYLPDADDIARLCTGRDAAAAARALVEYALRAGGHDNVTVAVIPIGGIHGSS